MVIMYFFIGLPILFSDKTYQADSFVLLLHFMMLNKNAYNLQIASSSEIHQENCLLSISSGRPACRFSKLISDPTMDGFYWGNLWC